jgi:hypothetical protein
MGEFARAIQPHLEALGVEGPEDLAKRIRVEGFFRGAPDVRRWMDGDPRRKGYGDLVAIQRTFDLSEEEVYEIEEAFYRDIRAQMEARKRERSAAE